MTGPPRGKSAGPAGGITRRAAIGGAAATFALAAGNVAAMNRRAPRFTPGLRFFAIGDWGDGGTEAQRLVARAMGWAARAAPPDFVLTVGDNFYPSGVVSTRDPHWHRTFESVYVDPALMCPWHPTLGNHDLQGSASAQVDYSQRSRRWDMGGRYYRVTRAVPGGVMAEFFLLDTSVMVREEGFYDARRAAMQLAWLESALSASRASWKIVAGHHPVFSGGKHGTMGSLVETLKPMLDRHGVAAFLNGHDHDLQHISVDGIHYLTSGAGARLRPAGRLQETVFAASRLGFLVATVTAESMEIAFVDSDNAVLHEASIAARG